MKPSPNHPWVNRASFHKRRLDRINKALQRAAAISKRKRKPK